MDLRNSLSVPNALLRIVITIGFLLVVLSSAVLFAWITKTDLLITLHPDLASMVFNTALGIFIISLGLITLVYKKRTLTYTLSGIAISLGFLTLIQYIFNINLGIDELFVQDHLQAKTSHPGRMAPNTALSMLFSGLNLLLANIPLKKSFWSGVNAIVSTLIAAFGVVALYGYFNDLENTYGWGKYSQMAVHTASSYIFIGLAQFIWAWHQSTERFKSHKWLPIPIGIFFSCSVIMLWGAMISSTDKNISFITKNDINDLTDNIYREINNTTTSLTRLARRTKNESYDDNAVAWQTDIDSYIEQFDELIHISNIVNQQEILDLINRYGITFGDTNLDKLKNRQNPDNSLLFSIFSETNKNYLLIFYPIHFNQDKSHYILAIFDTTIFLDKIITINMKENYAIVIKENERVIYNNNFTDTPLAYDFLKSTSVNISDKKWELSLTPKKIFLHNIHNNLSNLVLISGLLCALAFSLICLLIQKLMQKNILYKHLAYFHEQARQDAEFRRIHFQTIFDTAVEGIITIDTKGIIQDFNPFAETLFGYTSKDVIGKNVNCLMPEPYKTEHDQYINNYLTTNVPKIIGTTRTLEGKKKDGTVFPIELSVSKMNINDNVMFLGIVNDITERVNKENEIIQANEELRSSNETLQQFSYRTSHDLKSPLTTIKGLAKFIRMDIEEGNIKEALENTNKIASQAIKLEDLVMNILELAKAELQESNNIEEINIENLLEEIIETNSQLIQEKSIKVLYEIDSSISFFSEKTRVNQILENIIVNGIKYSDSKKAERFVKIKAYGTEDSYNIIVEDNGLGIPEQYIESIFTIFKRFHPKVADGSGMGMYIVKRHIDKLEAQIEVTNREDGTTFEIIFPNREHTL